MKYWKSLFSLLILGAVLISCSDDDENPVPVNEEEVITTMTITLTPQGGGDSITLQSQDLDGDGPNAPVVTVSDNFASFTTYDASIVLLNETEDPAENVTEEVEEEAEEHQFIFSSTGNIGNINYADTDANGNPVGIEFTISMEQPGDATLSVTLRHEPTKPNDGTLTGAGGETDIAQTFNLVIE